MIKEKGYKEEVVLSSLPLCFGYLFRDIKLEVVAVVLSYETLSWKTKANTLRM